MQNRGSIKGPARICLSAIILLMTFSWITRAARSTKIPPSPIQPIVAIADVHGDSDDFVAILQRTGLIDKTKSWIGGKTTFIQLGDLLDRGPKPRQALDLMMSLEKEAPKTGGVVVGILGNHEMMNIMGDLRYVTSEGYKEFADADSENRRREAYKRYVKWTSDHGAMLAELPQPMELTEPEWMARHPLGMLEQRTEFGPKGKYGTWLRHRAAIADIQGIIFLHGGISPDLVKTKIDKMNDQIRDEIKTFDALKEFLESEDIILPFFNLQEITNVVQAEVSAERKSRIPADPAMQERILELLKYQDWLSVRVDGPLWFRGYDQWGDDEGGNLIDKILDAYKATHIVVGHTVQKGGRIRPRFGTRVFLIDTGMLSSYYPGGRPSALEVCGETFFAVSLDQKTVLASSSDFSSTPQKEGAHTSTAGSPDLATQSPDHPCSGISTVVQ